jgi:hypothetical protein
LEPGHYSCVVEVDGRRLPPRWIEDVSEPWLTVSVTDPAAADGPSFRAVFRPYDLERRGDLACAIVVFRTAAGTLVPRVQVRLRWSPGAPLTIHRLALQSHEASALAEVWR